MSYVDPYNHAPSPYTTLSPSSAGNGASSYGSNGGASAGSAGTPAPHYATAPASGSNTPTNTQPATTNAPPTFAGAQTPAPKPPPIVQPTNYIPPPAYDYSHYNSAPNNQVVYYGGQPPPSPQPTPTANQNSTGPSYPSPPPAYLGYDPTTGQPLKNPAYEQWWASLTPAQQAAAAAEIDAQNKAAGTSTSSTNTTNTTNTTTATPPGNVMPGWDAVKWADPNKHDYKYDVGHILAGLPPRTSSMDAAVAAIAKLYPGATRVGNGDVNIPGLGVIDILQNAGAGGTAWQWDDGSRPAAATSGAAGGTGNATVDALMAMVKQLSTPPAQTAGTVTTADYTKDPAYIALIQKMNTQLQELQAQNTRGRTTPSFNYT